MSDDLTEPATISDKLRALHHTIEYHGAKAVVSWHDLLEAADEVERLERKLRNVKLTLIAVLDTTGPVAVPRTTLVAIGGQSTLTVDETLRAHSQLAVIFSAKATTDE